MKIEKVPSLTCEKCGSVYVIITSKGIECDNCEKPTVQSSDFIISRQQKKLILNIKENITR